MGWMPSISDSRAPAIGRANRMRTSASEYLAAERRPVPASRRPAGSGGPGAPDNAEGARWRFS